jgi:hypothetical protein
MSSRNIHRTLALKTIALVAGLALLAGVAVAQDDSTPTGRHSRKYKAPPPTAHVEVLVLKPNGKPYENAAVVFHPVKDGHDDGNLEMKTDTDGKAILDLIPIGSTMSVQVIADGYATFGAQYDIPTDTKSIVVNLKRPVAQYSTYRDDNGGLAVPTPGVVEPPKLAPQPPPPTPGVLPITVPPSSTPAPPVQPAPSPAKDAPASAPQ